MSAGTREATTPTIWYFRRWFWYFCICLVSCQLPLVILTPLINFMKSLVGPRLSKVQPFSWISCIRGPPFPPEYTSPRPRKRSRKNFTGHVFYQSHQPPLLQVLKNPFTTFRPSNSSSLSYQHHQKVFKTRRFLPSLSSNKTNSYHRQRRRVLSCICVRPASAGCL